MKLESVPPNCLVKWALSQRSNPRPEGRSLKSSSAKFCAHDWHGQGVCLPSRHGLRSSGPASSHQWRHGQTTATRVRPRQPLMVPWRRQRRRSQRARRPPGPTTERRLPAAIEPTTERRLAAAPRAHHRAAVTCGDRQAVCERHRPAMDGDMACGARSARRRPRALIFQGLPSIEV